MCAPATLLPLKGGFVLEAEFLACGLDLGVWLASLAGGRDSTLVPPPVGSIPSPAPGAMASRGRKRKAETALGAAAEKQETPASGRKGMEEASVVIEHW